MSGRDRADRSYLFLYLLINPCILRFFIYIYIRMYSNCFLYFNRTYATKIN